MSMSSYNDCRALAKGCAYYKKKYEELAEKSIKLETEISVLQTKGYVVTSNVVETPEFQQIKLKAQEYVAMTEKEKEQLSQESNVLLRSMTKLSAELSAAVETNTALSAENDSLKARIQEMLDERLKEQGNLYDEMLKNKDMSHESEVVIRKANETIQELRKQVDDYKKDVDSLAKYKGLYEQEHKKVIQLENELKELKNGSAVADDDMDLNLSLDFN